MARNSKVKAPWCRFNRLPVEAQRDGTMLVKVKIANVAVEDELTRKILALPEMTTPRVRLRMDVSP